MFVAPRYRPTMSDATITSSSINANGVDFGVLEIGSGPLALCLHGFPDTAHTWRHLLPRLAEAGFHAVAPFMRGYAPTSVPPDGRYQTAALSADAMAIHDALGAGSDAVIVGHDWGASATWGAANADPARWSKVIALAVPPGPAMAMAMLTNLAQLQRSWYMFFFQHGLADLVVPADEFAFITRLWDQWSPGYDNREDVAHVRAALSEPANLTAALGYYRATLGDGFRDPELASIQEGAGEMPAQRTLYLHGAQDGCIGTEVAEAAAATAPANVSIEIIPGAGHFLHLEQPAIVNDRIIQFLTS